MNRMILYMYVENTELKNKYKESIKKHNNKSFEYYYDSGFDLFVPEEIMLLNTSITSVDYGIKCEAYIEEKKSEFTEDVSMDNLIPTSYYLYTRSSIYKTALRMCNNVGIIDSGYRGNIKGVFDVKYNDKIEKYERINQICAPGLIPIYVVLLDNIEELSNTSRGAGGFGSTGK